VTGNTGTGSGLPGIIVHSNSAGDVVSGTAVRDNTLSGNGPDPGAAGGAGPGRGVGRALIAEPLATGSPAGAAPAVIRGTVLTGNLSTAEGYGSWLSGAPDSMVSGNSAGAGVEPVDGVVAASGLQEVP